MEEGSVEQQLEVALQEDFGEPAMTQQAQLAQPGGFYHQAMPQVAQQEQLQFQDMEPPVAIPAFVMQPDQYRPAIEMSEPQRTHPDPNSQAMEPSMPQSAEQEQSHTQLMEPFMPDLAMQQDRYPQIMEAPIPNFPQQEQDDHQAAEQGGPEDAQTGNPNNQGVEAAMAELAEQEQFYLQSMQPPMADNQQHSSGLMKPSHLPDFAQQGLLEQQTMDPQVPEPAQLKHFLDNQVTQPVMEPPVSAGPNLELGINQGQDQVQAPNDEFLIWWSQNVLLRGQTSPAQGDGPAASGAPEENL